MGSLPGSRMGIRDARPLRLVTTRRILLIAVLIPLAAGLFALVPHTVRGTVANGYGPVAGALVRLRATDTATTTDANGHFELPVRGPAIHQAVTAWKDGYYIAAADLTGFGGEVRLVLKPYTSQDHPGAPWLPSDADPNEPLACGNCHGDLHAQWRQDAHSQAARDPLVLSFYNGTDASGRPGAGPGFRRDFPDQVGNCATCHAPGATVDHPEGVDLNQVTGEAANGVFCQFCHSIHDARRPEAETTTGTNAISLRRPPPGEHLFTGPYDDVTPRDTYSPLQHQSLLCAACHSGSWWGVPAYDAFDQWQASPYAAEGVQCQNCHMAPDHQTQVMAPACPPGQSTLSFVGQAICQAQVCLTCHLPGENAGPANAMGGNGPTEAASLLPPRDPQTIFTHRSPGSQDEELLRRAVTLVVTATQASDGVLVEVGITNSGAGHSVPADSPLRNMLLLVTARDAQGQALPYLGQQVVPAWGGQDAQAAGNYAGQPGKGFAKVLEDWAGESPAPPWRNGIHILSDTRIPARATDHSTYPFALPPGGGPVKVEARLIYRRAFKLWSDQMGWNLPDTLMAQVTATAARLDAPKVAALPQAYNTRLFAPSPATTANGQRLRSASFTGPAQCSQCHTATGASWQSSGHAQAATSPLYRAWYKVADQNLQGQMGAFCAGCHAPIGLLSGQVRSRWSWWGQESYPLDDLAQSGVACDVCHSVAAITGTGNGAYVVAPHAAPQAPSGAITTTAASTTLTDPDGHTAAYQRPLYAQSEFCATCHQATNPNSGLPVMTTYDEWRRSRYNTGDPATAITCQGCHFAAGRHGELRAEDLKRAARVEVLPPAQAVAGQELTLQVKVSNTGAGHDLPTGAAELRQVWLAVTVTDATGRQIFTSGAVNEYGDPLDGAVTYGTTWQDASGKPTDRLWEAVSVLRDHRIPAGATDVANYRFTLPPDARGPLQVRAALKYRAAAGYLTSLMTIYLKSEVPAAPTIEMAAAQVAVPIR